jgi:hypothetical protein
LQNGEVHQVKSMTANRASAHACTCCGSPLMVFWLLAGSPRPSLLSDQGPKSAVVAVGIGSGLGGSLLTSIAFIIGICICQQRKRRAWYPPKDTPAPSEKSIIHRSHHGQHSGLGSSEIPLVPYASQTFNHHMGPNSNSGAVSISVLQNDAPQSHWQPLMSKQTQSAPGSGATVHPPHMQIVMQASSVPSIPFPGSDVTPESIARLADVPTTVRLRGHICAKTHLPCFCKVHGINRHVVESAYTTSSTYWRTLV